MQTILVLIPPFWMVYVSLPSLVWEVGTFLKEKICPAFRQRRREQRALPASVDSQLPSAQNNPYAKVAYFGVANSDFLHLDYRKVIV